MRLVAADLRGQVAVRGPDNVHRRLAELGRGRQRHRAHSGAHSVAQGHFVPVAAVEEAAPDVESLNSAFNVICKIRLKSSEKYNQNLFNFGISRPILVDKRG